jgi:predicted lipid-binding transport protein (Tim44 family)
MEKGHLNRLSVFLLLLPAFMPSEAWARGGGGCLAKGTPILTPQGPVPIDQLHPGDAVWTLSQGHLIPGSVQAITEVQAEEFVELNAAGCTLQVTPEHPFQITPGVFRQASTLQPGDILYAFRDGAIRQTKLVSIQKLHFPAHSAFNLLVTPGGTYLANGIVVHNKGCFLPDTPILKADKTSIPISEVHVGDVLLAFTSEGKVVEAEVRKVVTYEVKEYVIVSTDRVILRATKEHPFYVGDHTFKTLESLKVGDRIFAFNGQGLSSQPIMQLRQVHARTPVYNLQTDQPHTFFANGIAVHNKGGGGGGGGHGGGGGFHSSGGGYSTGSGGDIQVNQKVVGICTVAGVIIGGLIGLGIGVYRAVRKPKAHGWLGILISLVNPLVMGVAGAFVGFIAGAIVGCLWGPCGGIAIFLLFVFVVQGLLKGTFTLKDKKDEDLDFAYSSQAVAPKAHKTKKLLNFLARQDSSMAAEKLEETARSAFCKLEECWQARDYAPMKPLLMPDLYAQHCSQLAAMKRSHEINMIADVSVELVDIVNVRYTDKVDQREFTALISARARDYYVDDRDQKFLRGDQSPARFQEFWTFQLQNGAWLLREIEQSRESDRLKEENFVEMFTDRQVEKVYADTASPGGPSGPWLEKSVETKATRTERLLNFLIQTDKMWNRQQMLERGRQVFLNVLLAQESGDPNSVKADELFPGVAEDLKNDIAERQKNGVQLEFRNLCVRKVELILVRNYADNNRDEYTVRISAHAQKIVTQKGRTVSQEEYVTPFEQYWTFGRLDRQWKLKEILPSAEGQQMIAQENVDEESDPSMLKWFYSKSRAG